ncbi:RecQ family ATP-dependent DNA helicase [Marinoscillum pacificum]|uniref:RecQ family ATP-dependent DNA helicase n=1 Tax=Marinoscillum pacificum TaxID=392723 RepID=UPI002157200F|nr:ATP-dependent DNA helicase RecQ [Marinoscillum pacificum]
MSTPLQILQKFWGYSDFRPLQSEIIGAVLDKQPVLALLPTGGGKSICFQVPALCVEGICIVISPLIALMKDQVMQLQKRNIKAVAIYSGMSKKEIDIALDNCVYGQIKFLYVSPERLKTDIFKERAKQMDINLLAIDEAHCISQWGYDFRPPYLEIAEFIEEINPPRIVALTASATREVKFDILDKLKAENARVFQKSFARANLSYSVFELEHKEQKILEILKSVQGSSVVYVRSRKQTREIAEFLHYNQISTDYYHAGVPGSIRSAKQDKWIAGETRVMVATNAFGMGIDKPDVRTVIHYDLPDSLEAYYQEAGRAGRDEQKAYAIQLYTKNDIENLRTRTEQAAVSVEYIRRVYQALANYFKLAVGSNALSSFEFDYQAFARNFDLPLVETFHALNKLADEGLIALNEPFKETSKLIFNLDQPEVYKFQVANRAMDPVIKVLMRLYGGQLFTDFVTIKEKDIASLLGESIEKAYQQLTYLHQAEVVTYQRASDIPRITFLTPRYDANNLPLDQKRIKWRRDVTLRKAESVINYVSDTKKCRSRVIQKYFDEVTAEDCGVCDVCLSKVKYTNSIPLNQIEDFIQTGAKSEQDLKAHFTGLDFDDLVAGIRTLMDQRRIYFTRSEMFAISPE